MTSRIRLSSLLTSIFILCGFLCFLQSCDEIERKQRKEHAIALNAYNNVLEYATKHHTESRSGSKVGKANGAATFKYQKSSIGVSYSVIGSSAYELGELKRLDIAGSSDNPKNVSIHGIWRPNGTGMGVIDIFLSEDNNWLAIQIRGESNWFYWDEYLLESPDYILKVFKDAAKKKERLYSNSKEEKESIKTEKSIQKKRANVKTPLQEGVYYGCFYKAVDDKDWSANIGVIKPIKEGKEFYYYELFYLFSNEDDDCIGLNSISRIEVLGNGEFQIAERYYPDPQRGSYNVAFASQYDRIKTDKQGNLIFKQSGGGGQNEYSDNKKDALFLKTDKLDKEFLFPPEAYEWFYLDVEEARSLRDTYFYIPKILPGR